MTKREQKQQGKRLKDMRTAAGISEPQMAVNLEVSSKTITNYESGRTKASRSVVLAYEHFTTPASAGQGKGGSSCNYDTLTDVESLIAA